MVYNLRIKTFPDGTKQYLYCEHGKEREFKRFIESYSCEEDEDEKIIDEERSREVAQKRAVQKVFDIARSNVWDWFITLTFDPIQVDSFDYSACCDAIKKYTRWLREHDCQYIIVPEMHKSGRYHFHGLVKGQISVVPSPIPDIYNIDGYEFGFTTASKVKFQDKVSTYICKYITKDIVVPKGKKRYWYSQGLLTPSFDYECMYFTDFEEIKDNCQFSKIMHSEFGNFTMCEVQP